MSLTTANGVNMTTVNGVHLCNVLTWDDMKKAKNQWEQGEAHRSGVTRL